MRESAFNPKDFSSKSIKIKLKANPKVVKFVLIFLSSLAVFYFASILFEQYIPLFNMRSTTQVLYFFLKNIGIEGQISQNQITLTNFSLQVVRQCTGIFEIMVVVSCMLAYPARNEKKLVGIMMAVPIIYFFNMARLILLTLLGVYQPAIFDAVHDYLLQLSFMLLVILYWVFWINKVVKGEKE